MPGLLRPLRALRGARLADGALVDIELDAGLVTAITPASSIPAGDDELDLDGFLVITAPAEPHAHLDKARSWDAANPEFGDLVRAVDSWRAFSATATEDDIYARALAQATAMLQLGTTAVRTHVDLLGGELHGSDDPLRGARALLRVRERLAGLMDFQLVALGGEWTPTEVFDAALDLGVDLMGGAPHLAADPLAEVARAVEIADRRGVPIDLHTDESLDGPLTILEYARLTRGRAQPVSAGHCVRLGTLAPAELAEVIETLLAGDIGIISLPITNLYLQGWEHPVSTPRGLTALRPLLDAGVRVGAGADNVRDPFNPVGRGDALETASLLVTAGHLDLFEAIAAISDGARSVMSMPDAGPTVGARAELLAVRAESLSDLIATASMDRFVIHQGRLVASSRVESQIALSVEELSAVSSHTVQA
ncbi:amidohydrolase family protein [soil metagenome]